METIMDIHIWAWRAALACGIPGAALARVGANAAATVCIWGVLISGLVALTSGLALGKNY